MKKIITIALAILFAGSYQVSAKGKKSPCTSVTSAAQTQIIPANVNTGGYKRHRIIVWTDDMNNPYEGKPSRQNDGVKTNEQRNLNVTMTESGGDLPASDGSFAKQ